MEIIKHSVVNGKTQLLVQVLWVNSDLQQAPVLLKVLLSRL